MDYSASGFDTRQRFTFNAIYDVPFGIGRKYLNTNRIADYAIGGWSANATFVAQTGNPFTVYTNGISSPSGSGTRAIKVKDPFATGGTFTSPNPSLAASTTCATSTKNHLHWYNPCSFQNPWNANDPTNEPQHYIPKSATDTTLASYQMPVYVTSLSSVLGYSGGKRDEVAGPGYNRVNMSIFKTFKTYHEQDLTFRTDVFNLLNTASYGQPSTNNISSSGGTINSPKSLQSHAPDSRFFQLSLSYKF
jgi:hypothetical protein